MLAAIPTEAREVSPQEQSIGAELAAENGASWIAAVSKRPSLLPGLSRHGMAKFTLAKTPTSTTNFRDEHR